MLWQGVLAGLQESGEVSAIWDQADRAPCSYSEGNHNLVPLAVLRTALKVYAEPQIVKQKAFED